MELLQFIVIGFYCLVYAKTAPSSNTPNVKTSTASPLQTSPWTAEWKSVRHDPKDGPKYKTNTNIPFIKVNNDVIRIFERFPDLDDDRQNWGLIAEEAPINDSIDYNRPITFPLIEEEQLFANVPKNKPMKKEQSKITSSDVKNEMNVITQKQIPPKSCDIAIISCCSGLESRLRDCFLSHGCDNFPQDAPCSTDLIRNTLNKLISFYTA